MNYFRKNKKGENDMNNETKLANYLKNNKPLKLNFGKFAHDLDLPKIEVIKAWNALNRKGCLIVFGCYVLECLTDDEELAAELSPASEAARSGFYQDLSDKTGIMKRNLLHVYARYFNLQAFEYEPDQFETA